jgi:hypothetical protein
MAVRPFIGPVMKGESPRSRSSASYKAADLSVTVTSLYFPHHAHTLAHIHTFTHSHIHTSTLPHLLTPHSHTPLPCPRTPRPHIYTTCQPATAHRRDLFQMHPPRARRVHARQQQPLRGIVLGVSGKGLLIDMRPESRQEGGRHGVRGVCERKSLRCA